MNSLQSIAKDSYITQLLAKLFSRVVVKEFASKGYSQLASSVLRETGISSNFFQDLTVKDLYDISYDTLCCAYQNEYIYKNTIAEKILLGRHSINTASMLMEFRVGVCKADAVILNGSSTAYEIKTQYDNLKRLHSQIDAYRKVFGGVCVITTPGRTDEMLTILEKDIGVLMLSEKHKLVSIRKPESLINLVDPSSIFEVLRKCEYTKIVKELTGSIPDVPNSRMYSECKAIFSEISPNNAHNAMVNVLSVRGKSKFYNSFVLSVPTSLKSVAISYNLSDLERKSFLNVLNKPVLCATKLH